MSFAPEKVEMFLSTLNSDSAAGLDGINASVLKNLLLHIGSLYHVAFHLLGNHPTSLHDVNVKKTDPLNLLPIISKVIESIIQVEIK